MSRLVRRRIRDARLDEKRTVEELFAADLLALGAVADAARRARHGDRVYLADRADAVQVVVRAAESPAAAIRALAGVALERILVRPDPASPATGEEVLRAAAVSRLATDAVHVAVSWKDVGIELAQVALSFGVDELLGDGIPRAELEDLLGKAGREAA